MTTIGRPPRPDPRERVNADRIEIESTVIRQASRDAKTTARLAADYLPASGLSRREGPGREADSLRHIYGDRNVRVECSFDETARTWQFAYFVRRGLTWQQPQTALDWEGIARTLAEELAGQRREREVREALQH